MNFCEQITEQGVQQQQQDIAQDFHFGGIAHAHTLSSIDQSGFKFQSFDPASPMPKGSPVPVEQPFGQFDAYQHDFQEPTSSPPLAETDRSRSQSPSVPSTSRPKARAKQVVILSAASASQVPVADPTQAKVFPDEDTYVTYLKKRQNNNASATKSRQKKKQLEQAALERAKLLEEENSYLRIELQKMQAETKSLKEVLNTLLAKAGFK